MFASPAAGSVLSFLAQIPDPRGRHGRRHSFVAMLAAIVCGNQAAFPQNVAQKPGLGLPIARIAAVFSLACGAVVEFGICLYAGKGQIELGMLRALWDIFVPGHIVLADRYACAWTEMVMLKQRDVDSVVRLNVNRKADFRHGKPMAQRDHVVEWPKPRKPRSLDQATYATLPASLTVHECHIRIEQPGFRAKNLVVVMTIINTDEFPKDDLADLYFRRWSAELDLRSLKITLQMDILRCKASELVRKEI